MWHEAMLEELESFQKHEAWTITDSQNDRSALALSGASDKRFFTQTKYYDQTFATFIRYSSLRLLFVLSVKLDFEISHLDMKTALLTGYIHLGVKI